MPIDVSKVKWSSYGGYEGPVYYGSKAFVVPADPSFLQKCMAVVAAVEGHVDAVNMYDSGIVSLGTVQWIERGNMSVSDMMGAVAERCGLDYVLKSLDPALKMSDATFKKVASGKWRFVVLKDGKDVEVSTPELQRQCFLGCSGKKGSWTPESILLAKTWCSSFANVWESEVACQAQLDFSARRLLGWFVTPNAKTILFSDPDETGWKGAMKAIYVSFAVNVPAIADRNLVVAHAASKFPKWSREWCLDVIYQLVYGSGIAIWLVRYSGLAKKVDSLFGTDLPANAKDLATKKWREPTPVPVPSPTDLIPPPPVVAPDISPEDALAPPKPEPVVPVDPIANDVKKGNIGMIVIAAAGLIAFLSRLIDSCN